MTGPNAVPEARREEAGQSRERRRQARPGTRPALGSLFVHGAALALGWSVSYQPEQPFFVSYQIELVSLEPGEEPELPNPVVEAPPAPELPAPESVPAPEPEPTPEPPAPELLPTQPQRTEPRPAPPRPTETPASESPEAINVQIEGLRRDYPAYYDNIILQIKRCFRWSGQGAPEAEVYFVISSDGSVSDQRFVRQSGNPGFDYDALGSVECAGRSGRFGPLPEDLPYDRLPIRFTFRPGNVSGIFR